MQIHADSLVEAAADVSAAPHDTQALLPITFLYVPASHSEQAPPSAPEKPALHTQFDKDVLPVGLWELSGHDVHASDPIFALKV